MVDGAATGTAAHELDDERARVQRCLRAIAPRFQSVLALHYVEGLSVDEVARTLRCRPGTVKSRLARGRAALAAELARGAPRRS